VDGWEFKCLEFKHGHGDLHKECVGNFMQYYFEKLVIKQVIDNISNGVPCLVWKKNGNRFVGEEKGVLHPGK
jgi:hypothetical protein